MTSDDLDNLIERVLVEGAPIAAPDHFTDRVIREVRRQQRLSSSDVAMTLSTAIPSGALIAAGAAIWISLGDSPFDPSSLPLAVAGLLMAMGGLAWMWIEDPRSVDFRIRLSDLRPY